MCRHVVYHPPVGVAQAAMALCLVNICLKNFVKNLNGLLTNQPKQWKKSKQVSNNNYTKCGRDILGQLFKWSLAIV